MLGPSSFGKKVKMDDYRQGQQVDAWSVLGQALGNWANSKALQALADRAESGDRDALHSLQDAYLKAGQGEAWERWCHWGAEQEDELSIFRLTSAKSHSGNVEQPTDDSVAFIKYYAEKKLPWSMFVYGYQVGRLREEWDESIKYLRLAAERGVSGAQYLAGFLLEKQGFKTWKTSDKTGDNALSRLQSLVDHPEQWSLPCPWLENAQDVYRDMASHVANQIKEELAENESREAHARAEAESIFRKLVGQEHVLTYANHVQADIHDYHDRLHAWSESREGKRPEPPSFHLILTGAPGTGKNEIARALGQWYFGNGYTETPEVVEVSRSDLVAGFIGQTAIKTQEVLASALGKVLFIDEAYNLKKDSSVDFGQECIDTILKFMEDNRGRITIVAAGYQREMKSFIRSNPGFASRFPETLHLKSLNLDQIADVFASMCGHAEVEHEDIRPQLKKYFKSVVGKETFGNAREVRNLWERGFRRYKERLKAGEQQGAETYDGICFDDVFGHLREKIDSPAGRSDLEGLLQKLDSMVGLERVKTEVNRFVESELARFDDPDDSWLERRDTAHLLLLGPPGTGKTEVARIIGQIFHLIGLVPEDSFTELSRGDLVRTGVDAAAETVAVLDSCLGGVVFIDEIYTLVDRQSDYGIGSSETLETLMKYMEDHRGELAVIGAGYADKLAKILEVNPGLESRFGIRLNFDAYNADELTEIFQRMCVGKDLAIGEGVLDAVRTHFAGIKRDESFGNAREVRNLVDTAERASRSRESALADDPMGTTIQVSDLPVKAGPAIGALSQAEIDAVMAEVDNLVGVAGVREAFNGLVAFAKISDKRRIAGLPFEQPSLHYAFVGPPGTGKTTVARLLGRLFKGLGLLASGHVVEASRSDLVAGYVGQTALKTEALVERALGGVLFVDEAYSLVETSTENNFSAEAISTLLLAMENHRNELSVVFAGYTHEMEQFLATNPGLRSRVGSTIEFEALGVRALLEIAGRQLHGRGYHLSESATGALARAFEVLANDADFGNARGVRRVVDAMILAQSVRLADEADVSTDALSAITDADVAASVSGR